MAPQIVEWVTAWKPLIPKSFFAAPSSSNWLQHINRLCRAHCTRLSGANAGVDRQWFSWSKASQLVQHCEDRLSATDSAAHGDWLFHMVMHWTALDIGFPAINFSTPTYYLKRFLDLSVQGKRNFKIYFRTIFSSSYLTWDFIFDWPNQALVWQFFWSYSIIGWKSKKFCQQSCNHW